MFTLGWPSVGAYCLAVIPRGLACTFRFFGSRSVILSWEVLSRGLGGKVSLPAPPLLACRSFLQELVGGPHAWYSLLRLDLPADLLLPFLTRERPLLWCSLSAGTSGCLRRWSPPVIGASGTPTRGYGARVARCLARTPWFVRVGRGLVPCPSAQNGCWVGAGGVVSR